MKMNGAQTGKVFLFVCRVLMGVGLFFAIASTIGCRTGRGTGPDYIPGRGWAYHSMNPENSDYSAPVDCQMTDTFECLRGH